MTSEELLSSVFSILDADVALQGLLGGGFGSRKVRYVQNLDDKTNPIVTVDPSPTFPVSAGLESSLTVISFSAWTRAEGVDDDGITDPQSHSIQIVGRLREIFTGRHVACTAPRGVLDSVELPKIVEFDHGAYWRGTVRVRFGH